MIVRKIVIPKVGHTANLLQSRATEPPHLVRKKESTNPWPKGDWFGSALLLTFWGYATEGKTARSPVRLATACAAGQQREHNWTQDLGPAEGSGTSACR